MSTSIETTNRSEISPLSEWSKAVLEELLIEADRRISAGELKPHRRQMWIDFQIELIGCRMGGFPPPTFMDNSYLGELMADIISAEISKAATPP